MVPLRRQKGMAPRVHTMGFSALQSKLPDLWPQAANVASSATLSVQGPETVVVASLVSDTKGLTDCIQYYRINKDHMLRVADAL